MATRSKRSRSELSGSTPPAFGTVLDPSRGTFGDAAADLSALAGVVLLPWQKATLDEWLECDDAGRLTRKSCALVVPRRNGKTALLLARMLFGLYILGERRVNYTAQDNRTAFETFESMCSLVESGPFVSRVRMVRKANGQQRIDFKDGGRFVPTTRTGSAGRGLETDLLILDEAMYLDPENMAALTPLVAKAQANGRGQIIAASSAGTLDSAVFLGMRDRGRVLDGQVGGSIAYREWCAPDDADPADPVSWKLSNPSLGTSILEESFLGSQLAVLGPSEEFRREHLGRWGVAGELPAIDLEAWLASASPEPPARSDECGVWMALDLDFARTASRLLLFDRTPDGKVIVNVLEATDTEGGLDEVAFAERVAQYADQYGPDVIGYDPQTGETVARLLESHGHKTLRLPLPRYASACHMLKQSVADGRIVHDGNQKLSEDIARAIAKPTGDGGFVLSRLRSTTGPIAGAIALAIGHYLASSPDTPDTTFRVA